MSEEAVRVLYDGKPKEYIASLRTTIFSYDKYFKNPHSGWGKGKFLQLNKNTFVFRIGAAFLKPGDSISEVDPENNLFPLVFTDGSLFSIAQTFIYDEKRRLCLINKSVIRFLKVKGDFVQYLFHYDSEKGDEMHPPFHLQFEYDTRTPTPRFRLFDYENAADILSMIVRDRLTIDQ
ncbi:hypothetical protein [Aneurinibacillus tyrosinisolvens]|uniref:hypothetical protein n=1 Tax=Aneurinibacillus tyrosinisolvens TaxID=1443435 RepID=UPI00063FB43D|nr:hypothetical protein [Aneurinibacillus tyrosinisolvens]